MKATKTTVPVVTTVHEDRIILELTRAEAETLFLLAYNVGGYSGTSRRGHVSRLNEALEECGISLNNIDGSSMRGHLYFEDEKGWDDAR